MFHLLSAAVHSFFFFFGMCLYLVWRHDLMFIKGIFLKGERSYSFLSVSKDT